MSPLRGLSPTRLPGRNRRGGRHLAAMAPILQPGDVLLYRSSGLVGWAVRTKTWSDVDHSETYLGGGFSAAARGQGVATYPLRLEGLKYVLRPRSGYDIQFSDGLAWHKTTIGQPYDHLGLLRSFFTQGRGNVGKQWCSEHTCRFAEKSGYFPFGQFDCEKVSPSMFLASPVYEIVWKL